MNLHFMILHKNTENYQQQHGYFSLFCTFMEYESNSHNIIIDLAFLSHSTRLKEMKFIFKNLHKIWELTHEKTLIKCL